MSHRSNQRENSARKGKISLPSQIFIKGDSLSSDEHTNSIKFGDAVTSFLRESIPALDEHSFRTKSNILNKDL